MIAKGTTHNNGAKLARYIVTGKEGERAELWQLHGFASKDIREAFRSVHVMAEATKCQQPFFHVQVRNREGEKLSRQQWATAAARIMSINGLTGQPYAIAFHADELTGDEHMHLAVSLIDGENLKAKRLPFFKGRLKTVSRELEREFGLQPVKNERAGPIKYAPTRAEDEQARRLGVDIHEVRNTMRACWDHSTDGRSFEAALAVESLILAHGDRRGLVVIDHEGGVHALGKRILDVTPARIKARLADLAPGDLPTIAEVRAFLAECKAEHTPEKPAPGHDADAGINRAVGIEPIALENVEQPQTRTGPQLAEREDREIETPARAGGEAAMIGQQEKSLPLDLPSLEPDAAPAQQAQADGDAGQRFQPAVDRKPPGIAQTIRQLFREVKKALTGKAPAPKPAQRRRRGEETRSAFRLAFQKIMRRIRPPATPPPPAESLWLADTMDWMQLWHEEPNSGPEAYDEPTRPDGFDAAADCSPGL